MHTASTNLAIVFSLFQVRAQHKRCVGSKPKLSGILEGKPLDPFASISHHEITSQDSHVPGYKTLTFSTSNKRSKSRRSAVPSYAITPHHLTIYFVKLHGMCEAVWKMWHESSKCPVAILSRRSKDSQLSPTSSTFPAVGTKMKEHWARLTAGEAFLKLRRQEDEIWLGESSIPFWQVRRQFNGARSIFVVVVINLAWRKQPKGTRTKVLFRHFNVTTSHCFLIWAFVPAEP